jgi:hypothetical protein
MLSILQNIPNIKTYPLKYIFEIMKLNHKPDTLWLEFGVFRGKTINYISKFTTDSVYGFDSFEGLPEAWRPGFGKGYFNTGGSLPLVNNNVVLIKGWFDKVLPQFIESQNKKKISFLHIDCDIYSSAKYILDSLKHILDNDCVVVFDELVNYPGFDGPNGELKAFYEFINENNVCYSWIGMNGVSLGMRGHSHESVALIIHSIGGKSDGKIFVPSYDEKKCLSFNCTFNKHTDLRNNGGNYCCQRCRDNNGHGPACQKTPN